MPFLSIIESADSNILKSAFLDLEGPSVAGKFVDTYRTKNDPYFTGQDDKPEEQEKIKNERVREVHIVGTFKRLRWSGNARIWSLTEKLKFMGNMEKEIICISRDPMTLATWGYKCDRCVVKNWQCKMLTN